MNINRLRRLLRDRGVRPERHDHWLAVASREEFTRQHFTLPDGTPWQVRDYQRDSLESRAPRKVHCDGRDVGKTTEIEITACWAAMFFSGRQMLIATQCENHLYPLMHRLCRRFETIPELAANLVEMRRTPSWHFRFDNGFTLWGRIAGPRGVNFQGMHVDWQIVDEAQELTETAWGELLQALNAHGRRWVYGVPNGLRNSFYRMTQDRTAVQVHWPSTIHPDYTPEKDAELARLYGGTDSPGYLHRVLGRHGEPAHGVFSLDDYQACIDPALPVVSIVLRSDDSFDPPTPEQVGRYYLGCDLGYARDPSEFVVYRDAPPHLVNVLRVRLEGVNYARQEDVIVALDRAWDFVAIGIDAGNNGRAVSHRLMTRGEEWCARVHAFEFGSVTDAGILPDGTPARRRTKEFMTDLLRTRMAARTIVFPALPDRETEYASHACTVDAQGRVRYDKGNDHLIDADRCALLVQYLDTAEPAPGQAVAPMLMLPFGLQSFRGWE